MGRDVEKEIDNNRKTTYYLQKNTHPMKTKQQVAEMLGEEALNMLKDLINYIELLKAENEALREENKNKKPNTP
jgi:hypothetical protein